MVTMRMLIALQFRNEIMSDQTRNIVCPHCVAINRIPTDKPAAQAKCGRYHKSVFSGKPCPVSAESFAVKIQRNDIPVVVDFWADWCGPCKMMAPSLEEIATNHREGAIIAKVNIDESPALTARYRIQSIPTLLYFSDGELRDRTVGVVSKKEITNR